jgi:Ca-activated chloride channel homolog
MSSPNPSVRVDEARRVPALVSVDGRAYPLRSAQLRARAEGGIASSSLVQVFANPYDEPLEVVYTLPLPADGAVLGYSVRIGERVIRGEVQPRQKAEAAYLQALYEGRTTGLLEQDRNDTFQQRLGNLPPRTEVAVEIEVLQPLAFLLAVGPAGPSWEYRFPTVVGARYQGAPGRVSDAERIDLDRDAGGAIPSRLAFHMVVSDSLSRDQITSPSHHIEAHSEAGGVTVHLAEGVRLDRDLVVQWPASSDDVGVRVVEGRGHAGDTGRYALFTVTPPNVTAAAHQRDLTVLLDASGSMAGPPLEFARRVVTELLQNLDSRDRFEVIAFASAPHRLTTTLEQATSTAVERCLREVNALQAGGGTEMGSAIEEALTPLRNDAQHQVVLVSDGYIGFERELLAQIANTLPAGVRLHTVGIGSAPNRALTQSLARGGRGVELLVSDEASAVQAARRLCAATARPVLTDLRVGGKALRALAPAKPHDVLAGQPVVVAAELDEMGGSLEVTGKLAGSPEVWSWKIDVPRSGETEAVVDVNRAPALRRTSLPLGPLFGREAIADAELQLAAEGASSGATHRIASLAMRHRVTSRYTSLVAIAEELSADPKWPRRSERLAVELPAGVSAEGVGLVLIPVQVGHFTGESETLWLADSAFLHQVAGGPATSARAGAGREHLRMARGRPLPDSTQELGPSDKTRIRTTTVVHVFGSELILQFESPFDGFQLPAEEVAVFLPRRWKSLYRSRRLTVRVTVKGTRPGRLADTAYAHPVRLVLRLEGGKTWPEGRLILRWKRFALELLIPPGANRGVSER